MKTILLIQAAITLALGFSLILLSNPGSDFSLFGLTGNDIVEEISSEDNNPRESIKILGIIGVFLIGFAILELVLLGATYIT